MHLSKRTELSTKKGEFYFVYIIPLKKNRKNKNLSQKQPHTWSWAWASCGFESNQWGQQQSRGDWFRPISNSGTGRTWRVGNGTKRGSC